MGKLQKNPRSAGFLVPAPQPWLLPLLPARHGARCCLCPCCCQHRVHLSCSRGGLTRIRCSAVQIPAGCGFSPPTVTRASCFLSARALSRMEAACWLAGSTGRPWCVSPDLSVGAPSSGAGSGPRSARAFHGSAAWPQGEPVNLHSSTAQGEPSCTPGTSWAPRGGLAADR